MIFHTIPLRIFCFHINIQILTIVSICIRIVWYGSIVYMPARMILNKNSIEKAILFGLVGGAVILSPMGSKVVIALVRYYVKKWWEEGGPYVPPESDAEQVRQSIYKLKRNHYVRWRFDKKENVARIELTPKGQKVFGKAKLDDITVIKKDKWDGQWRFFLFDVPEKRRSLRDVLRSKLKNLGFFQFQKSVWIYPFECERELRYVCEFLGITPYTMMFAAKIDNDRILRRYFLREGVLLRRHLSLLDKGMKY